MSRIKPAQINFYFDADVLGLAKVIVSLRPDVTYPGDPGGIVHKRERPACMITSASTRDEVWIPQVAARNWLIVTRDSRIQLRRAEIQAVRESGARMVALASEDARSTFDQFEVLLCRWRYVMRCLEQPGPFIYAATRTAFRPVPLD